MIDDSSKKLKIQETLDLSLLSTIRNISKVVNIAKLIYDLMPSEVSEVKIV